MDMQLLKRATKKITMQNDMQQRLVEKCRAEEVVEPQGYDTVVIDMPVPKMKPPYFRYVFTCLAVIVMLTISGILLYNGVEFEVGTYESCTWQFVEAIQDITHALDNTSKAEGGEIYMEHHAASQQYSFVIRGEVILKDITFTRLYDCFQYYNIIYGYYEINGQDENYENTYTYKEVHVAKRLQNGLDTYYEKIGDIWKEVKVTGIVHDAYYKLNEFAYGNLFDFKIIGSTFDIATADKIVIMQKGTNKIYNLYWEDALCFQYSIDKNNIVREKLRFDTEGNVVGRYKFSPGEVTMIENVSEDN